MRVRIASVVVILVLMFTGPARSDDSTAKKIMIPEIRTVDVNGSQVQEVWIKPGPGQPEAAAVKVGEVKTIPIGTVYYHWGSEKDTDRWASQGKVDEGEVAFLTKGFGAAGGGYYVSTNPIDSEGFGPAFSVFTTTDPVTVVDFSRHGKGVMPMTAVGDWNEFNSRLRALGVDGTSNFMNDTWLNLINAEPLTRDHRGTWVDFENSAYFNSEKSTFADILTADAKIPAPLSPWLKNRYPFVEQLLSGKFDPSVVNQANQEAIANWLIENYKESNASPLALSAKKNFTSAVIKKMKSEWESLDKVYSNVGISIIDGRVGALDRFMSASRKLGVPWSEWLPGIVAPADPFKPVERFATFQYDIKRPQSPTANRLNTHLSYQNLSDTLRALATGASIETLYDQPGLAPYSDRWKKASDLYRIRKPLEAFRELVGNSSSAFRDEPASSDGDILYEGKKYFQVDAKQKAALEKNPYIISEFLTISDPSDHSSQPRKIEVARYDYPSAANFEKFESLIMDQDLLKDLKAAKQAGLLANSKSQKFRKLTRKMLENLVTQNAAFRDGVDQQIFLTSLHPYSSMNTEAIACTVSAKYNGVKILYSGLRTKPGRPDEVLLRPIEELVARMYVNADTTAAIQAAFLREETLHPNSPNLQDVPELWQAGRKTADIGPDAAKFVAESKAIFANSANCVAGQVKKVLGKL